MHSQSGRLPAYCRVLDRLFGIRQAGFRDVLLSRAPVLLLFADEGFLRYLFVAFFRAILGRRTVGLLSKPIPLAASRRWRCRWRRAALRQVKRCRFIRTLSTVPFNVFPKLETIAAGWVYDFEMWDLTNAERAAVETLRAERRPGDYLILTTLGKQDRLKGFDLFSDSCARHVALRRRFRFIACGQVEPSLGAYAAVLDEAGGAVVDRRVSNAELLGAYAASDIVWCFYPPVGDHSLGVFGRAAQLGLPVLVRQGSPAHRLCVLEDIPHLAATIGNFVDRLAGPIPARDVPRGRLAAHRFARHSEATLRSALGLEAVASATDVPGAPSHPPSAPPTP